MIIVLVSKCSLDIEQYVEFKMSVLISPSRASLARVGSQLNFVMVYACRRFIQTGRSQVQ